MAEFIKLIKEEYGAIKKVITKRNPQSNAIIERVHQTLGSMIRSFAVQNMKNIDENDPWSGILTVTAFVVRSSRCAPKLWMIHSALWLPVGSRKQGIVEASKNESRR